MESLSHPYFYALHTFETPHRFFTFLLLVITFVLSFCWDAMVRVEISNIMYVTKDNINGNSLFLIFSLGQAGKEVIADA